MPVKRCYEIKDMVPDTDRIRGQLDTMASQMATTDANNTYRMAHLEREVVGKLDIIMARLEVLETAHTGGESPGRISSGMSRSSSGLFSGFT